MSPIHTILLPTDLSKDSMAAFDLACALASDYGARLIILSVYPPLTGAEAIDRDRHDGIAEDLLARLRDLNPDPAIPVEFKVEEGRPADLILSVAEEIPSDLIVMGSHGRSGMRRLVLGSVAEAVSRGASCPVLMVRGGLKPRSKPALAPVPGEADNVAEFEAGRENWRERPGLDPTREVVISLGSINLHGTLQWSGKPRGVVVFAHGSGSSRHSPRNRFVADVLVKAGFATLLMDLLTEDESEDQENVFDIALLADRLAGAA